ncbi:hypothetical protein ACN28C_15865 [Plantactinospora sp. WMMC1484]|uniref:hypothetical protein n=1 Tax=Plantactinospora sp. WMMC1484 TaxID=3404122 RepID=UPI003BF5B12E
MTDDSREQAAWADLEPIAKEIFNIWNGSPELRWAEHAWAILSPEGLTRYSWEDERTHCVLRLLALGVLYREFCARAFDEGEPGQWRDALPTDLIGEYPWLDPFTLGQVTERAGIVIDNSPWSREDAMSEAVAELVEQEYPVVRDALAKHWGDAGLFATLWVSTNAGTEYPLDADQVRAIVNHDLTANKHMAYGWIAEGLPL